MIRLFFIFDQLRLPKDNIRKCFIELRPGIPGTYKGLIYCASMDEARDVFSILSPYIQKFIKNDLHIAIKRGCTEFDLAFPGYKDTNKLDKIYFNNDWENFEKIIARDTINDLKPKQLSQIIYIRNEGQTALDAINRQLAHYPYHVGQIVFYAKMIKKSDWESLTIPKNKSNEYNADKFSKEKTNIIVNM